MRHLLMAAALGIGLFSAGALTGTASASPIGHAAVSQAEAAVPAIAPVHYDPRAYRHGPYRPYYAPPPHRHWQRYQPPPRHYHPPPHRPGYGWRR